MLETEPNRRIRFRTLMKNRLLARLAAASLLTAITFAAAADPTPQHAAACVAALENEATSMAEQVRNGQAEVEPELVRRVQQGFAFIGSAYKQGLRGEEADRMLKEAERAQQSLPPAELAARQAACRTEGAQLLAHANLIERAFVERAAQRRVDKLKRPPTSG
jgi:hypothetical protein